MARGPMQLRRLKAGPDKAHRSEIRETRNVKPLLRIERSVKVVMSSHFESNYVGSAMYIQNVLGKNGEYIQLKAA